MSALIPVLKRSSAELANAMSAPGDFANSTVAGQQDDRQPSSDVVEVNQSGSLGPALDFLDDFFGTDKRHLVAIKKGNGKN